MSISQQTIKKEKTIFFLSVAVAAWFLFLIIAYELHFGPVWLGVITEMFTIPALLLLLVLLIFATKQFFKSKFKIISFSFAAIIIILLTILLMIFTA